MMLAADATGLLCQSTNLWPSMACCEYYAYFSPSAVSGPDGSSNGARIWYPWNGRSSWSSPSRHCQPTFKSERWAIYAVARAEWRRPIRKTMLGKSTIAVVSGSERPLWSRQHLVEGLIHIDYLPTLLHFNERTQPFAGRNQSDLPCYVSKSDQVERADKMIEIDFFISGEWDIIEKTQGCKLTWPRW